MRPLSRALFVLLMLLPLLLGAGYAAYSGLDPSASWSAEEPAAAPGATDLVPARRAAGEASSQAGFLSGGTGELSSGSAKLADGMGQLSAGGHTASQAASELASGMNQIQAGTGQLGVGATKIADGVQQATDQINGIGAIQAQIVKEIDRVSKELEKNPSPEAAEFRKQLAGFRGQVETFKLDPALTDQLNQLRTGSRDLANQLAVPGYGYHDGIYSATKGSKELAAGLAELDKNLAEASAGAGQVRDGAAKVDGMAKTNKEKITGVQRALPADVAPAASEHVPTFIPLLAFLIAALVTVGASLTARWGLAAVLGMGSILALVMATDIDAVTGAGLVGIVALSCVAAAALARGLVAVLGPRVGSWVIWGGLLLQVGVVGWVWKSASRADISGAWSFVSALMPMHYTTAALTSAGNSGAPATMWTAIAVLVALAVFGVAAVRGAGRFAVGEVGAGDVAQSGGGVEAGGAVEG